MSKKKKKPDRRAWAAGTGAAVAAVATYDVLQRHHAILRNFPIIGHGRFLLEKVGPELRQYIVTSNDEERPFSRDQRRWVYASSKGELNSFGFGSDNEMEAVQGYVIVKHGERALDPPVRGETGSGPEFEIPCTKVLGAAHARRHAFRPRSIVNISGMSYGALSAPAVEAMNRGARLAGCLHNTGEGGMADAHLHGGELIFQIGTGYFGCRDEHGRFDLDQLGRTLARGPVRALEIKLSQGAKPGLGGHLPGPKVTGEIAGIRGVPPARDCISPASHSAFTNVTELIAFIERLAAETGLPVGIKSAVGQLGFWEQLAAAMAASPAHGPDFITIDGGEGGTGAAPLSFSDNVSLPFKIGFGRVYGVFAARGLTDDIVFIGAGKLGFPQQTLFALGLGCDMVNVGREAMLSVGCIQAQRCHSGHCPTGVATQSPWLTRGLEPGVKAVRCANYLRELRKEVLMASRAAGAAHPGLVGPDDLEIIGGTFDSHSVRDVFGYEPSWRVLSRERRDEIGALIGSGGEHRTPTSGHSTEGAQ